MIFVLVLKILFLVHFTFSCIHTYILLQSVNKSHKHNADTQTTDDFYKHIYIHMLQYLPNVFICSNALPQRYLHTIFFLSTI